VQGSAWPESLGLGSALWAQAYRFKAVTKARLLEARPGSALPASGLEAESCTSLAGSRQNSGAPHLPSCWSAQLSER